MELALLFALLILLLPHQHFWQDAANARFKSVAAAVSVESLYCSYS